MSPKHFYDREAEINRILLRLLTIKEGVKNDVVLIGPRRVGKSSILSYLEWKLLKKEILPICIDCEGLDLVAFLKVYGNATIEAQINSLKLMKKFGERLKKGFTEAISVMSEALGRLKAVEVGTSLQEYLRFRIEFDKSTFHKVLTNEEIETLFDRTIELPNKLDKKCVVMIDEFQDTTMYSFSRGDFHANFRNKIKYQKNVAYIYTGSSIGMMDDIFADPKNPLAGGAEIIYVEPFDRKTSIEFLKTRFNDAGRRISDNSAQYIYNKVGGFPLYLNWVGLRVCDFVRENNAVKLNTMKNVYREILSPKSPIYHMLEKQLIKLGYKTQNVMTCLAMGYRNPPAISKESNVKNIYVYLDRLQKYGLAIKKDSQYDLVDPILKEYLIKYK
ncbi:MAG: ATP-binding protein [Thermoplasmata archaeon]|nr:MAG: ATP-binding protein [Thermoplasmata archaeon]